MPEPVDVASIPSSREGYALDTAKRLVHRRWALHARGLPRVKSVHEVRAWLGAQVTVCPDPDCWVPPVAGEPAAPAVKVKRSRTPKEQPADDNELLPGSGAVTIETLPLDTTATGERIDEQVSIDAPDAPLEQYVEMPAGETVVPSIDREGDGAETSPEVPEA